ncbi:hypothetical protein [Conchiformibius steedae]|uniref:hypothetical protein n=1 Tax=Conchiformibius steedae TaxID=153493 RepID=UPI0026E923F7|nr:hypothetical protein [Conchiformibius steedae]
MTTPNTTAPMNESLAAFYSKLVQHHESVWSYQQKKAAAQADPRLNQLPLDFLTEHAVRAVQHPNKQKGYCVKAFYAANDEFITALAFPPPLGGATSVFRIRELNDLPCTVVDEPFNV